MEFLPSLLAVVVALSLCNCATEEKSKNIPTSLVPSSRGRGKSSSASSRDFFQDPVSLALTGPAVTGLAVIGLTGVAVVSLIVPFLFSIFMPTWRADHMKDGGQGNEHGDGDGEGGGGGGMNDEAWKDMFPFPWEDLAMSIGGRSSNAPNKSFQKVVVLLNAVKKIVQLWNSTVPSSSKIGKDDVISTSGNCHLTAICELAKVTAKFRSNGPWNKILRYFNTSVSRSRTYSKSLTKFLQAWRIGESGIDCSKAFGFCLKNSQI